MERKLPLIRTRSRSEASSHRSLAPKVTGVIWYPGGPIDNRTYANLDLTLHPLAKEVERSRATSLGSTQKQKKNDQEEKTVETAKKDLERLHGVGLGTTETDQALKRLTYQQIKEPKVDYPVLPQWERECKTPAPIRQFQRGLCRKKSRSIETKLPLIKNDGFPERNWIELRDICKSLNNLGL